MYKLSAKVLIEVNDHKGSSFLLALILYMGHNHLEMVLDRVLDKLIDMNCTMILTENTCPTLSTPYNNPNLQYPFRYVKI